MTGWGRLLRSFPSPRGKLVALCVPRVIFLHCSLVVRMVKWMEHSLCLHILETLYDKGFRDAAVINTQKPK